MRFLGVVGTFIQIFGFGIDILVTLDVFLIAMYQFKF